MKNTKPTSHAHKDPADLLEELGATDVMTRLQARRALVRRGEAMLPVLLEALEDDTFLLRWEAAKALGELKSPKSVPALVAALEDEEQDVRWLAGVALAAIGHEALRPLLEAVLKRPDSPYLRQGAHLALTLHQDDAPREPLLRARAALGPMENPADLVPALEDALRALDEAEEEGAS